jgi:heme/copper-type cytochrome/quinol oxidase subunit 2
MAPNDLLPPEKQRNPVTQEAHRHQAFWQIYFPMILFGAFVIVAFIIAVLLDSQGASKWADISLIYMISLAMVTFLITMIIIVVTVIYTAKLIKATPYFFFIIQKYAYLMEVRVKRASNMAAEPFLRVNSFIAGARALRKK